MMENYTEYYIDEWGDTYEWYLITYHPGTYKEYSRWELRSPPQTEEEYGVFARLGFY